MQNKKILIIDDEPDVVKYISTVLSDHGYDSIPAAGVDEALSALEQIKPDLILLDIMMPKKSGVSFYQHIKADSRFVNIPIIIVSGIRDEKEFDFREFVPDTNLPEADAFIEKPIKVEQFVKVISEIIE